jgi:hypothetical protein
MGFLEPFSLRFVLLVTILAIDRSALGRFKWYLCLNSALRASHVMHFSRSVVSPAAPISTASRFSIHYILPMVAIFLHIFGDIEE